MLEMDMIERPDGSDLEKFARDASANVLVGFLSGRMHTPNKHKGKSGNYEDGDGSPATFEAVETAELAKRLSFGDGRTPARPFLEDGLNSQAEKIRAEVGKQIQNVRNGGGANWDKIGTMAVGAIQEFVRGDYYKANVPNAEKTIEYKGSDTPLIDSGDLLNSLEYVVEGK